VAPAEVTAASTTSAVTTILANMTVLPAFNLVTVRRTPVDFT
jgi:hypothetical protein